MIGLLVLGALIVWFFIARGIAKRIAKAIPISARWHSIAAIGIFVIVFLLPVADELAAWPGFGILCHNRAVLAIDAARIKGKTVRIVGTVRSAQVDGAIMTTYRNQLTYVDASSGEVLGNYETYTAKGGVLARAIGFPPSHSWTGSFYCAPDGIAAAPETYGFSVLR
jgi:hypothetical protein